MPGKHYRHLPVTFFLLFRYIGNSDTAYAISGTTVPGAHVPSSEKYRSDRFSGHIGDIFVDKRNLALDSPFFGK